MSAGIEHIPMGDFDNIVDDDDTDWAAKTKKFEDLFPLPAWIETDDGWYCDDREQLSFAQRCAVYGFNVPAFDQWLTELEPCGAKCRMLELRHEIFDRRALHIGLLEHENGRASQTLKQNLEIIKSRQLLIEASKQLTDLAFAHARTRLALDKGRAAASDKKKQEANDRYRYWRKIAADMFRENAGWSYERVAMYIQKQSVGQKKNNEPYSTRSIIDKIQGVKDEVWKP